MDDQSQRDNIALYYRPVDMPGGYSFDMVETLKFIELYYNSKFESGDRDSRGFKKFFYNIVKPACDIASKFIDLDTKDIFLTAKEPEQDLKVWVMQQELMIWLKENKMDIFLNKLVEAYPKYGHIFSKKMKDGKWDNVNIHNLRFDPSSSGFKDDLFFYEVHDMTRGEIEDMNWNQPETIKALLESGEKKYVIYELYDREGDHWKRQIKADLFLKKDVNGQLIRAPEALANQESTDYVPSKLLHEDEMNDIEERYRELKWEELPGRRLGRGFVEYLSDNQIAENEAENLERRGLFFTSLHIFQTRDDTVGRNVLTDVENGDILKMNSELIPVQTEERNLPAFNATRARWATNTERKTFSFDIARGEQLPSRTPLGVAQLSAGMVAGFYDLKREKLGIYIKDLILDNVIPAFKKDRSKEHILTVLSNTAGIEKIARIWAEAYVNRKAFDFAADGNGFFPMEEERKAEVDRLVREILRRKTVSFEIPDSHYDDAKFILDLNITGEQFDVGVKSQTMQIALQILSANPAILANRATRNAFFELLKLGRVSPIDLGLMNESAEEQPPQGMMQGGSVAVPRAIPGQEVANQMI